VLQCLPDAVKEAGEHYGIGIGITARDEYASAVDRYGDPVGTREEQKIRAAAAAVMMMGMDMSAGEHDDDEAGGRTTRPAVGRGPRAKRATPTSVTLVTTDGSSSQQAGREGQLPGWATGPAVV
jgi:hypothetical protein